MSRGARFLLAFLLAGWACSARAQNIIDTTFGTGAGSFELGSYSGDSYMTPGAGSTVITGWTVENANIDWLASPVHGAYEGTKSIDLGVGGRIVTTLPTTAGLNYQIGFNAWTNSASWTATVQFGSSPAQTFSVPTASSDAGAPIYSSFSYQLAATTSSTELRFVGVNSSGFTLVIDNVSVTAVPEPSAGAALGGLAALGLVAWHRRCARRVHAG